MSHDEDNGSYSNHEYKILTPIEDQIGSESDNCDSIDLMTALKEIDMLKNGNKNQEKEIILYKKKGFVEDITQLKVCLEEAQRIEEVLRKQLKQNKRHYEKLIRIWNCRTKKRTWENKSLTKYKSQVCIGISTIGGDHQYSTFPVKQDRSWIQCNWELKQQRFITYDVIKHRSEELWQHGKNSQW